MLDVDQLMHEAIAVCRKGISAGQSPFGCVIATAKGGVVSVQHNTVRAQTDPTAHAEVNAIRKACDALGRIDLSGHVLFTTCEPCPMCAAAIHWARLDRVIYGATIEDAANAGFNELHLFASELYRTGQSKVIIEGPVQREACAKLFEEWQNGPNASPY